MSEEQPAAGRPAPPRCRLPNGMEVAYQSRVEVAHFYDDIFVKQVYLRHGLSLPDGATVFDVGANVGFFTLFSHRHARDVTVYAFEPAPPLFEILRTNVALHGVNARLFNFGISDANRTADFTFYPKSSGMSSFYADAGEEKEALRAIMQNQLRHGVAGMEELMRHADDLLEERFASESFACRLRPLSEVIAEQGVERIDLLKIDVQKSELDVLRGIAAADWPKIGQVVLEVHDLEDRLPAVLSLLESHGFEVTAEQDDLYEESVIYNLYARHARAGVAFGAAQRIGDRARKQQEAMSRKQRARPWRRD
jgi:FkbM family methyltransferase